MTRLLTKSLTLLPKNLTGQMIALLLAALVAAQAVSLLIFFDERRQAVRMAVRAQVLSRTVSIVRLLADTPPELSPRIIDAASGPRLGFWLGEESAVDPADPQGRDHPLQGHLVRLLRGTGASDVLVFIENRNPGRFFGMHPAERRMAAMMHRNGEDHRPWRRHLRGAGRMMADHHRTPLALTIAVHLADGRWLNAETLLPPPSPAWAWPSLVSMAAMAVAITLIVVLSVRRITRPMRGLAVAADGLGRGEDVPPLPERGPEDVRRATRAFNDMQARLQRFVRDRTRMLAAISHDLRTPITSLRLRAEFIEDREVRGKIIATLEEMQEMTEAVLAFAREDAESEETRKVDLAALVESLCDDLSDAGLAVRFGGGERTPYACRPVAFKRAVRNLIENAVAYGGQAQVALVEAGDELRVVVEDDGPGIPEEAFEKVFEPFVRLEGSRSRETGGVGLGLAIARSIARAHGGDIGLENRPDGGLRATLRVPRGPVA